MSIALLIPFLEGPLRKFYESGKNRELTKWLGYRVPDSYTMKELIFGDYADRGLTLKHHGMAGEFTYSIVLAR